MVLLAIVLLGLPVALGCGWILCRACTYFGWRKNDARRNEEFIVGATFSIYLLAVNLWLALG